MIVSVAVPKQTLKFAPVTIAYDSVARPQVLRDLDREVTLPARITTDNTEAYMAAALAGLGLIQAPLHGLADHLRRGELVEVLVNVKDRVDGKVEEDLHDSSSAIVPINHVFPLMSYNEQSR